MGKQQHQIHQLIGIHSPLFCEQELMSQEKHSTLTLPAGIQRIRNRCRIVLNLIGLTLNCLKSTMKMMMLRQLVPT